MKKFGFTLAEVLITLLIIGVVATLTAPALINNVGDAKVGPQLAKFVNTFENAMQDVFMEESISTISEFPDLTHSPDFINALAKYMIMSPVTDLKRIDLKDALGTASNIGADTKNYDAVWQTKDGYLIQICSSKSAYSRAQGSYTKAVMSLLVDLGGIKGQHRAGKEVFLFLVDNRGILVPYAGKTHKWLTNNGVSVSCSKNSSSVWENLACTGEIADNGYKKSSK